MSWSIEIRHNFETAHRLTGDGAPTKCVSIHGHSWWATLELTGPSLDELGILVEFGALKKAWRGWLDDHVDHHLVLKHDDPMIAAVRGVYPESRILETAESPTTEVMAKLLFDRAELLLRDLGVPPSQARVARVHIQETAVNAASYSEVRPG